MSDDGIARHDPPIDREEIVSAALMHVGMCNRVAETAIANRLEAIQAARDLGASWEMVGRAMGLSRQTAHKRFGNGILYRG